jgi:hypothetical protein
VTSPYLNRPTRSLREVLRTRGLTPADIGVTKEPHREKCSATTNTETGLAGRHYGRVLLIGMCMIPIIWIALAFADADRQDSGMTAVEMETEAQRLEENIMPAAGQH